MTHCSPMTRYGLSEFFQLRLGIINRGIFSGFREAPIRFPPTYKYDVGTNVFDTSDKMRVPSWTDRIILKSKRSFYIEHYSSVDLDSSDHKPVAAFVACSVV